MKNLGSDSKLSTDPSMFAMDTMSESEVWFPSEPKSLPTQLSAGDGPPPPKRQPHARLTPAGLQSTPDQPEAESDKGHCGCRRR